MKIDLLNKEKEELIRENVLLSEKLKEVEIFKGRKGFGGNFDSQQQFEEIQYLEARCEEYLNTISEKESKIRNLELINENIKEEIKRDNEERIRVLERKIQEQKHEYESSFQSYLSTIREL